MAQSEAILIVPDRIYDGVSDGALEGWGVLVEREKLVMVAPIEALQRVTAVRRLDLAGCTLLPGLIDLHSYLSIDADRPNPMAQMYGDNVAERSWVAANNLKRDLASGVTTLRVMGEGGFLDVAARGAIASGLLVGPELTVSGFPITPTGGHQAGPRGFDGIGEVKAAVRRNVGAGVDWIKVVLTGGINSQGLGPTDPAYAPEVLRAIVEEANRLGRPVAAAAHGGAAVVEAMKAGVKTIEHGALLTSRELEAIAAHGGYLVVTPSRFLHSDGIEKSAAGSPDILLKLERVRQSMRTYVPQALKAGIKVVLGTDNMHGYLVDDLAYLVEFGATPAQAIRAATSLAADAAGISSIGILRRGLLANLLAVEGNPLNDILCLKQIKLVMQRGKIITILS
jgi:imidazolonepropionase-like amidohydrolase